MVLYNVRLSCDNVCMLSIVTAMVLATAAGPPSCCLRSTTFVMQESTRTTTSHRIGHVVSPAILTTSFYGAALYFGADKKQARLIAVGLSVAAIFMKEVYDRNSAARSFSSADVGLGILGTAAGLYLAEVITWPEEKRTERKQ